MAALNEEQSMVRDQARAWVSEQAPVQKFRELRDSGSERGFDPDLWAAMCEMGWPGILVPEEFGGSGLGHLTLGLVLEETGRQLTASPLVASALAGASALLLGGNEAQKREWLPRIVDGSAILTLAVDESAHHGPEGVALKAEASGGGFKLNGSKGFVLEGGSATAFVVAARSSGSPGDNGGITLFLVGAELPGISRSLLKTVDCRGYANVDFQNVEVDGAAVLGEVDGGYELLNATLDRVRAGLGAEMLGTAVQAFDMTLEYLKTRKQFGQVIGSFQGLGHRAADLFTEQELARSCVEAALQGIDRGADDIDQLCSLSKCKAGDFLHHASNELIQIHGGIGMTDEFDAGFYLKRARVVEALFGNQAYHRDRYARLLGY